MESTVDATTSLKQPIEEEQSELDLYTIPSSSSWFSWDEINETEKNSLKEFFNGSSFTRTPKIYKEYRDFIINKYREDPSRKLTFTAVRKSLVGDVTVLHKVFDFLEKSGLINFSACSGDALCSGGRGEKKFKVRVEEGAPNGVRVVEMPNSLKPVSVPMIVESAAENGVKLPPLASYADVFGDSLKRKRLACGHCGETCDSGHHECTKEGRSIICIKCFSNENYGENKSDDFKYVEKSGNNEAAWTEEETLLLLESVLKHGDDWELVAQSIPTRSRLDCISKLIELPFGDLILDSAISSIKQAPLKSSESQKNVQIEDPSHKQKEFIEPNGDSEDEGALLRKQCKQKTDVEHNGDSENGGAPIKKQCIPGNSLMKQVALISTMVSPNITASAADATISALCNEYQLTREIFNSKDDDSTNEVECTVPNPETERSDQKEDLNMKEMRISETEEIFTAKNAVPQTLRMKAAIATALGAAAAHAKLLADQEERGMEQTMATIIEGQLKKLNCKVKIMKDLEQIMEKEHYMIEELEQSIIAERIDVLEAIFSSGISRWRDHATVNL